MSLTEGTRLGPYEITGQLGKGGMGEVYRATDTRLDRRVAIKVLPEPLASDPQRRERFEREARAVSSLNHPNICTLHDVGVEDGAHYLVMELVEGETLEARLERGRLSVDETLELAVQIADALDKAHRQGVVHRDLKPANIMLTPSGVKLLDFGLAKLKVEARAVSPMSQMPTEDDARRLTGEGTILGTLQYMAPEQLDGDDADARTDIFAFGAIVYEMVTGRKAFSGRSQASLISSIMSTEPEAMRELQETAPRSLDYIVRTCLAKNPDDRWQTARDLMREIRRVRNDDRVAEPLAVTTTAPTRPLPLALAGLVVGGLLAAGGLWLATGDPPRPVTRLSLPLAPAQSFSTYALSSALTISPDGRRIAFVGSDVGLWLRELDQDEARPLTTSSPRIQSPVFSPDGEWIAYDAGDQLMKIPANGGSPSLIVPNVPGGLAGGISWGEDGYIVYAAGVREPTLMRVHQDGGAPGPLTDQPEGVGRGWPHVIGNGRAVLFSETHGGSYEDGRFGILDVAGQAVRYLDLPGGAGARVTPNGLVVYARAGNLMAAPFDLDTLEVTGPSRQVLSAIAYDTASGSGQWAVAANGTLVFREGAVASTRLMWIESGGPVAPAFETDRVYYDPKLSPVPGDLRIAVEIGESGDNIWVLDPARETQDVLSFSGGEDETPVWSPDGRFIAWTTGPDNERIILRRRADRSQDEEELWRGDVHVHVAGYSPDGRFLLFEKEQPSSGIWLLPLNAEGLPDRDNPARVLIDDQPANEFTARVSPDGRWIAYVSDESSVEQIYVQPFPELGRRTLVSTGREPVWSRDGGRLFYRDAGAFWSVDVEVGSEFVPGPRDYLFDDLYDSKGLYHVSYDVTEDARFLVVGSPNSLRQTGYLRIYENWLSEVGNMVGSN